MIILPYQLVTGLTINFSGVILGIVLLFSPSYGRYLRGTRREAQLLQ